MKHPLIGLSGKKRTGKDTAAEALIALGYKRFAFADVMKEAVYRLDTPIGHEVRARADGEFHKLVKAGDTIARPRIKDLVDAWGWEGAKQDHEVRRLLQVFGTEVGRSLFGENFWVEQTMRQVAAHDGPAVITDVRFPNEARAIEKAGLSWLLRIERPGLEPGDQHASETALDDYEFEAVIKNNSTIDALHKSVTWYAEDLRVLAAA
jgi:hypothetical protein